ncbi:hypothetical protein DFH27DRAFT_258545 [Peziza echinospora]|nr:hypothetical protein DFH27DRAFT_258545 [Peziza echinospora]
MGEKYSVSHRWLFFSSIISPTSSLFPISFLPALSIAFYFGGFRIIFSFIVFVAMAFFFWSDLPSLDTFFFIFLFAISHSLLHFNLGFIILIRLGRLLFFSVFFFLFPFLYNCNCKVFTPASGYLDHHHITGNGAKKTYFYLYTIAM